MSDLYDDSFRADMVGVIGEVLEDSQAAGVLFREKAVRLATVTVTGADPAAGEPGTETITYVALSPRPKVDARDQWRWRDGAQVRVGDAALKILKEGGTLAALLAASFIEVGGETAGTGTRYTLVAGQVKEAPFFLTVILSRLQ